MSAADFHRLLQAFQKNSDLMEEFKSLQGNSDHLHQWARERGFDLTREELKELADSDQALSDEELENVAGGDDGWTGGSGGGGGG